MRSPVVSTSVTQSIVQDLGAGIVTGRFSESAFPSESLLCEHYGAARTVVREAVKMLVAKGLISTRPRQGIRIAAEDDWNLLDPDVLRWLLERKFSMKLLVEFTQIRLDVEPGAAALAAIHATAEDRRNITRAIERMYAAENGDDDSLTADIAFHVAVLNASGNRFYRQLREMISTALHVSIQRTNKLKGVHKASAKDHDKVAKAILSGDPEAARKAMFDLIDGVFVLMGDDAKFAEK
ncbi:FadR/GntR family transcriptional regulator [Asticcacaulis sp. W401b]|uniref:FadR/GntR family transcriptional regulator n=1 Tax=Asticcacaulis sp. W401b TaxID=3388666 RepID=UPI003970CA85